MGENTPSPEPGAAWTPDVRSILENIPGGILVCAVADGLLTPVFCSGGVAALSGHTQEEYLILLGDDAELYASSLLASHVNWISGETPAQPVRCAARTRYSQTEAPCTAYSLPDGGLRVVFDQPQRAITPGQAVVLYDGDVVLGGGTIEKSE